MRVLLVSALLVAASCSGEAAGPLPEGPLSMGADGMVRAGGKETADPVALLRARISEGAVSIAVDPRADVEKLARLLDQAERAGVRRLACEGFTFKLEARPPELPKGPQAPEKREIRLSILAKTPEQLRDEAQDAAGRVVAPTFTVVFAAPVLTWQRLAPLLSAVESAIGARVVRHELELAP